MSEIVCPPTARRRFLAALAATGLARTAPNPKRVVLTFDDAVKSHLSFVAPLLAKLGMRATFFVSHRWMPDREQFLTWAEVAEIHRMGFEIGNHSWTHADFSQPRNAARLAGELALVDYELARVKVPKTVSYAHTGNTFGPEAIAVLRQRGIRFARRGVTPEVEYGKLMVGAAFDPRRHHPLLIPTTGDAYPDWTFEHFLKVLAKAREGEITVLQFHGVPDIAHPWVHTPPEMFERYMRHLKDAGYETLALADLERYIDAGSPPADPLLERRNPPRTRLALPVEVEASRRDRAYWLRNTLVEHRFTRAEAATVLGESESEIEAPAAPAGRGLRVLPYPGGRHTRIGFLDGAIEPLRGTKASVFVPWESGGYVVVDLPEAIFSNLGLLYLAHTHIPTYWNERNVVIDNVDWDRLAGGALSSRWELPNRVAFGALIEPRAGEVAMELWLRNGTDQPLTGLRTQICVLPRAAPGFEPQTNDNKVFRQPTAAVRSADGRRWILTEWERCGRVWGNPNCPCLHSDPVLPDCAPGEEVRVKGRLWFREGSLDPAG